MSASVLTATAAVARAAKSKDPDRVAEARRNLAEAKIAAAISEAIASAPPLTADQRVRLASILNSGGAR